MADAGIKVIVVNSKTDSTDDAAMAYVGPNDVEAGEMLAQWVIDNVPDGGKYAHCQGVIGNSAQIQRGEGIENIMKDNGKFESVGDLSLIHILSPKRMSSGASHSKAPNVPCPWTITAQ